MGKKGGSSGGSGGSPSNSFGGNTPGLGKGNNDNGFYTNPTPSNPSSGDGATAPVHEPFHFELPQIQFPDFSAFFAQQQAAQEAAARAAARARGEAQTGDLWSARLDAASEAISLVDQDITNARAHAAVTGQDYSITPEQRTARINNQFADLWSEGQESQLAELTGRYGNPEQDQATRNAIYNGGAYEWEYTITRGEEGVESNAESGGRQVGGPVRDFRQQALLADDDTEELRRYLLGS